MHKKYTKIREIVHLFCKALSHVRTIVYIRDLQYDLNEALSSPKTMFILSDRCEMVFGFS